MRTEYTGWVRRRPRAGRAIARGPGAASLLLVAALAASAVQATGLARAAWAGRDDNARAQTHFQAGAALHRLGNYDDAIREFSAGYAAVPRPEFLLNLGQAYRMRDGAGDLDRAREMYRRYLADVPSDDRRRDAVRAMLAEIEGRLIERVERAPSRTQGRGSDADGPTPPANAAAAASPALPSVNTPAPAAAPALAGALRSASEGEAGASGAEAAGAANRGRSRAWWALLPVGAAALAGAGVGIYFGVRPEGLDCASLSLGCGRTAP